MAVTFKKKSGIKKFRLSRVHVLAAVIGALLAFSVMLAQSEAGLDHRRADVARSETGHPLTPASRAAPEAIIGNYLSNRGRASENVASLRTTGVNAGANGVTHVRMEQQVDGVSVYGAYVKAAINSNGELVSFIERIYDVTSVRPSRIDESQALTAVMGKLYPNEAAMFRASAARGNTTSYDGGPFFYGEPSVTAVALPMEDGSLQRGWLVQTWTAKTNELYHTVVDGNGRVLDVESRTANDSYNVYVEDPSKNAQTIQPGGAGWLGSGSQTTTNISGNNAHAYLDTDANNAPDAGGSAVTDGNFLTAANLTVAPTTAGNKAVAVQNLFYLNNTVHDILYSHGFNEAAGNFQINNFGNGGAGNDAVNAEAQDGSGTDNANFATPADGSSPRMQMYLWTGFATDSRVTVGTSTYPAMASVFGPALTTGGTAAAAMQVMTPADGCAASSGSLAGKVAIIARGNCDFTVKVMNAQTAGATSVIITNNVDGNPITPGGTNRKIKIPSVMVSLADGNSLRGLGSASATLKKFATTALQIDGDIDADIVFHEYGHGLTWRMIGGMSGKLAGAIGEGASDVNAFLINGDDRMGEYAYSNPLGIRRYPYDGYPNTYSDVTGGEVHDDGEIYAAAMWNVYKNYAAAGVSVLQLQSDFVDGMNYTNVTPAFEDMRDGMLQSVAGTGRECLIWRGFAKTGIGVGAKGTISRRGAVSIIESFQVPAGCPAP